MAFGLLGSALAIGGGGATTTPAQNTTGAKLIVLAVTSGGTTGTPTDSAGNTWLPGAAFVQSPQTNSVALFYCLNPTTSPTHTFSFSPSLSSVAVSWWSASAPQKDKQSSASGPSPGSITPATDGELLITACSVGGGAGAGTASIGSGFTILQQAANNGAAFGLSHAYLVQPIAAAINPAWATNNGGFASAILSFVDAVQLAGTPRVSVSAAGLLSTPTTLAADATIRVSAAGALGLGFQATPTIALATAANLRPGTNRFAAATAWTLGATATIVPPPAQLAGTAGLRFATRSKIPTPYVGRPLVTLDGLEARARVGTVTVRDILNDAPNTATLTLSPAPVVAPVVPGDYAAVVLRDHPSHYWRLGDAVTAYAQAVRADGAMAYWRLGETSGLVARDELGVHDGTITGGVTLNQPGAVADGNPAMLLNGTTGYVVAPLTLGTTFSIEAWIKTTATAFMEIAEIDHIQFYVNGGTLGANVGGVSLNTFFAVADGQWHHVVLISNGTVGALYVDGVFKVSGNAAAAMPGTQFYIGRYFGSAANFFNGAIDDVAVYPTVLTLAQIAAHYSLRQNVARDAIGTAHGAISGGVTLGQTGALADGDTAMTFDGATSLIVIPAGSFLAVGTGPVTVECWIKTSLAQAFKYPIDFKNNGANGFPGVGFLTGGSGQLYLDIMGTSTGFSVGAAFSYADNQWHHLVGVVIRGAPDVARFYVDGVLLMELPFPLPSGQSLTSTVPAGIGSYGGGGGNRFTGSIDDVAIYPTALTAAQVTAHYAARLVAPVPPPAVYAGPPQVNQRLRISVENNETNGLLFAGTLQAVDTSYDLLPHQLMYPVQAIDDTARLNFLRPFGAYTGVSATTVALALCAAFAPTFDTTRIAPDLPVVTITFDGSEPFISCLARLAAMIGGYTKVEDLAVYLFLVDDDDVPDPLDGTNPFHDNPHIVITEDVSQQRTRVYGRGHGEQLLGDVVASDTILPLVDVVMFNPVGGRAVASTTPDGAVSERFTYSGIDLGGAGSLAGPGVAPSSAPTATRLAGAGLGNGVYRYAYTDVTAAGTSLPSPLSAPITTGLIPSPGGNIAVANATNPTATSDEANGWDVGDTVEWYYAYGDASSPNNCGLPSAHVSVVAVANPNGYYFHSPSHPSPLAINLTMRYATDPQVTRLYVWYRINGGTWWTLGWNTNPILNVPTGGLLQREISSPNLLGPQSGFAPTNPAFNQVSLTDLALGPGATTARDLYRTIVNGADLKFLQRVANNTSTGPITDATPDASLGASAPTSDTSGLTTVVGQINAGSTSLLTASAAPFAATGGWVTAPGNPVIRYTGLSGNTLTGIPSSGSGSILTTIQYGDPIVAAPALLGVTGLTKALMAGARVCLLVRRDDALAQATYGVIEYLIVDERRGEASLAQLCDADLQRFARPLITVRYASRDPKTKSGKTIVIALDSPPIHETLTIQEVTITEIGIAKGLLPRYTVTASSVRFSLEDILRQLAAAAEAH